MTNNEKTVEKIVEEMRETLDADVEMTRAKDEEDLFAHVRWGSCARMIALVAGTDATTEFTQAQHRYVNRHKMLTGYNERNGRTDDE